MSPRVTEAHLEARREQILAAATQSFAERGLHVATVQDIASVAGLSAGALYRYFPSKEAIIEAMAEQSRRQNAAAFASVLDETDMARALATLVRTFFERLKDPAVRACLPVEISLWSEAVVSDDVRRVECDGLDEAVAALRALVALGQARGDIAPDLDSEGVAQALASTFLGLQVQVMLRPDLDIDAYVDAVTSLATGSFWTGPVPDGAALESDEARASNPHPAVRTPGGRWPVTRPKETRS